MPRFVQAISNTIRPVDPPSTQPESMQVPRISRSLPSYTSSVEDDISSLEKVHLSSNDLYAIGAENTGGIRKTVQVEVRHSLPNNGSTIIDPHAALGLAKDIGSG